ncbi:hypothetical protein PTB14_12420 [Enterococcus faecalis]|nr:hypothetical protein [Enterococcus faecalis]MDD0851215.1 hypothetical protein [Enterococcus faecalis]
MDILGDKENKIAKIKKELKDKNLLYEKRIPPKKLPTGEFKNYPNRLYLGKLEVSATDVYAISNASHTNEFSESGKKQPNLYLTNSLDTIDTEKERLQQQLLLDQFSEVQENTFLFVVFITIEASLLVKTSVIKYALFQEDLTSSDKNRQVKLSGE